MGKVIAYAELVNESKIGSMTMNTCDAKEMSKLHALILKLKTFGLGPKKT